MNTFLVADIKQFFFCSFVKLSEPQKSVYLRQVFLHHYCNHLVKLSRMNLSLSVFVFSAPCIVRLRFQQHKLVQIGQLSMLVRYASQMIQK